MLKKIIRSFFFLISLSLLAIFQISAISLWPGFWGELNLVLIVIVSLLFFYNIKTSLFAVVILGFCLDLFSFSFFGLESLSLLLSLFILHRVSTSWLTNKSIYSFLLMNVIFCFSYLLLSSSLFYFFNYDSSAFFLFRAIFWKSFFFKSSWSLIIAFISFTPLASVSNNLRPMFLDKN